MRLVLDGLLPHLLSADYYSFALALVAFVRVAVFGPCAFALVADYLFVLLEFELIAFVDVLKWYCVLELFWLSLAHTATAHLEMVVAKEVAKDGLDVMTTSPLIAF